MYNLPNNKSLKSRFKHNDISLKIDEIEKIYAESSIKLHSSSQLSKLIESARKLSEIWSASSSDEADMDLLFKTLHIERIASALEFLKSEKEKTKYLKDLLNGTLNFFERKQSHAKSILWELEVWTKIKNSIPETYLAEPDVVINY